MKPGDEQKIWRSLGEISIIEDVQRKETFGQKDLGDYIYIYVQCEPRKRFGSADSDIHYLFTPLYKKAD